MKKLLLSPVLAAGVAAIGLTSVSRAQSFNMEMFDPQTTTVHVGGNGTSFLGVNLREIDSARAKDLKLKEEAGVEITRVEEDSPAAKAGLKVGDVVLAYNGERVEGMDQFSRLVRETPPGREVKLLVSRDGNQQTLTAQVGARKMYSTGSFAFPRVEIPSMPMVAPMPDLPRTIMMWRTSILGIEAEALHGQLANYFGVKEGVLVRSVMNDTPAAKAGLKAGDVIVKIGDSNVSTPNEVTSAIRSIQEKKSTVPIVVLRDHKELTLTAPIDEDRSDWDGSAPRVTRRPVKL
jgi:serine protease Do